jgi:hypothetical protein
VPSVVPGQSSNTYSVQIPNYPCGSGLRCFGATPPSGVLGDVFPKGAACPSGSCCDTILWNQNGGVTCPNPTPVASQCRHQQLCIQGKQANATCTANCSPGNVCGPYTATIRMCESGITAKPYLFYLTDGTAQYQRISNNACESFQVSVTQLSQSFQGYVADVTGCKTLLSGPVTLTSLPQLSVQLGSFVPTPGCGSSGTFTATVTGGAPGATRTFSFQQDSQQPSASSAGVYSYSGVADGQCHQVSVSVRDTAGCSAGPVSQRISQCVVTTQCT